MFCLSLNKFLNYNINMEQQVSTYQETIQYVFKNQGIAIASFYTNACGPCKKMQPFLNKYMAQFGISVASIDAQKAEELCMKFDIHAIPTYILLKKDGGQVNTLDMIVSAHPQRLLKLFENAVLQKSSK